MTVTRRCIIFAVQKMKLQKAALDLEIPTWLDPSNFKSLSAIPFDQVLSNRRFLFGIFHFGGWHYDIGHNVFNVKIISKRYVWTRAGWQNDWIDIAMNKLEKWLCSQERVMMWWRMMDQKEKGLVLYVLS